MNERYTRLFSLPKNLYTEGSPVIIAAGALLKDNQTGHILAQLKFRSIQEKTIKALTVRIFPQDTAGNPLKKEVTYQFLDLAGQQDDLFGQNVPIFLPDDTTRAFNVCVTQVIYTDNSTWDSSDILWEPLGDNILDISGFPETTLENAELAKQYHIHYGSNSTYLFHQEKDLWRCICGSLQHTSETECHKCHRSFDSVAHLDLDILQKEMQERLEAEAEQAAARKAAQEEAAKKAKKIAKIAIPAAVVVLIIGIGISNHIKKVQAYEAAKQLRSDGYYIEAIAAFKELGDYRDSAKQAKDSAKQAEVAHYEQIRSQIKDDFYSVEDEIEELTEIKAPKDYQKTEIYEIARTLDAADFTNATELASELYDFLGDYKDSTDRALETHYRALMHTSFSSAYQQMSELKDAPKCVKELMKICEPYLPYCGEFTCTGDNANTDTTSKYTLTSSFHLGSNDTIIWYMSVSDEDSIILQKNKYYNSFNRNYHPNNYRLSDNYDPISSDNYHFFDGAEVKNMVATDTWNDCVGRAAFKNNGITITVNDDNKIYYSRQYTKIPNT